MAQDINSNRSACVVFAKWPELGRVKTRLAADTGPEFATEFYRLCCMSLISEISSAKKWKTCIAFWPVTAETRFRDWLGNFEVDEFQAQTEGGLGEKMWSALTSKHEQGFSKVVLVGTDIPELDSQVLSDAFTALDESQVVLGPAVDGGFYLVGTSVQLSQHEFKDVRWSTRWARSDFAKNLLNSSITVDQESLPKLLDIDTLQDLQTWLSTGNSVDHSLRKFASTFEK